MLTALPCTVVTVVLTCFVFTCLAMDCEQNGPGTYQPSKISYVSSCLSIYLTDKSKIFRTLPTQINYMQAAMVCFYRRVTRTDICIHMGGFEEGSVLVYDGLCPREAPKKSTTEGYFHFLIDYPVLLNGGMSLEDATVSFIKIIESLRPRATRK